MKIKILFMQKTGKTEKLVKFGELKTSVFLILKRVLKNQ